MAERLLLAGAGNAEKGINAINPRFQAEALRRIRGRDTGVLDNSFYTATSAKGVARTANSNFMWKLSASNVSDIAVGRGMATAYGYDLQSEQTVHLVGTAATTGTKYIFVYLEWDLHNPDEAYGSINLYDNGSSSSWTPVSQDNLITNPTGIYQMPLYRLTVNTAGTVTATANWTSLGVATIGYPLRSEYANRAEEADHADKATDSDTATTAKNYNTSSGNIKTKFDTIDTRLANLGFKSGAITFCGTAYSPNATTAAAATQGLFRQGNYVTGKLVLTNKAIWLPDYAWDRVLGTIPANFRPSKAEYITITGTLGTNFSSISGSPFGSGTVIMKINTDGTVEYVNAFGDTGVAFYGDYKSWLISFGYEAPAIT